MTQEDSLHFCQTNDEIRKVILIVVASFNQSIASFNSNVQVVPHTSYGRIYLRWRDRQTKRLCANFESLLSPSEMDDKLTLNNIQAKIEHMNSMISLQRKRMRHP